MSTYNIRRGKNIKLKGAATGDPVDLSLPKTVGIHPLDFVGMKPRVAVQVDDHVKVGSPVLTDKVNPELKVVSPVSGKVVAINRGPKRVLLDIVIEADGRQEKESFATFSSQDLEGLIPETVVKTLLDGGLWPVIRQRPFSKIAHPEDSPKAIFVHAMSTEPLALDVDTALSGKEAAFQTGVNILKKLTEGSVHICYARGAMAPALTNVQQAQTHRFAGPHPAGNVSTHIYHIDPLKKGDIVWYVEAQDVVRIGQLFTQGSYPVERMVAVTGEGTAKNYIVRTIIGAPIKSLVEGSDLNGKRCISGSVLTGKNVGAEGFLSFYDSQISIIPEGGRRELLGWLSPGFNKFTFSNTYLSSLIPMDSVSLDTDTNGSDRAIVLPHLYDRVVPLDIMVYFLLRAVISGDIEEAERLGILECDEEDFALCTFLCPSKTDVGGIIKSGLDLIEKEG